MKTKISDLYQTRTLAQVRFDERSTQLRNLGLQASRFPRVEEFFTNLLFALELWASARHPTRVNDRDEAARVFGQFWRNHGKEPITFGLNEEGATCHIYAGAEAKGSRSLRNLKLICEISPKADVFPDQARIQVVAIHDGLVKSLRDFLKSDKSRPAQVRSIKFTRV
jgi:hypothetical protein